MKQLISLGIVCAFALILLMSSCSVVPPGCRGISVTLGKVSSDLKQEGLAWKKPFVEKIVSINIQQFRVDGKTQCFSSDLQTVTVSYAVLMRPPEAKVIELYRNYFGQAFESLVQPRLEEGLKQFTAGFRAEDLVKSREKIKADVMGKVREEVGELVIVSDILITNIDLTDEMEKAIETKQVMEQSALAKTYELQKEQKEAEITIVKATAEAESVRIKGEALKGSPEVIQLEIAKKWNGVSPASVVVTSGGANVLLPLK